MAERDFVIVTGASENHATPLLNLLFSLDCYEPELRVFVYDLGLSDRTRDVLRRQRRILVPFRFAAYPEHIAPDRLRNYAWKPIMVHEVMESEGLPLLYLDAGDLVHERLNPVRRELAKTGLYSPTSSGTLARWCYPATLEALQVEPELLSLQNRNGAIVGFGATAAGRAVADAWFEAALRPDVICPPGSDRYNHRFDQSLLTVLFYRASRRHGLTLEDGRLGISIQNDRRSFTSMSAFIRQPAPADPIPLHRPPRKARRKPRGSALQRLWRKATRLVCGAKPTNR